MGGGADKQAFAEALCWVLMLLSQNITFWREPFPPWMVRITRFPPPPRSSPSFMMDLEAAQFFFPIIVLTITLSHLLRTNCIKGSHSNSVSQLVGRGLKVGRRAFLSGFFFRLNFFNLVNILRETKMIVYFTRHPSIEPFINMNNTAIIRVILFARHYKEVGLAFLFLWSNLSALDKMKVRLHDAGKTEVGPGGSTGPETPPVENHCFRIQGWSCWSQVCSEIPTKNCT